MLLNQNNLKKKKKNERLYRNNYSKMLEIKKKLNGIDPLSLRTTNQPVYMKYYRASKVIEKIKKKVHCHKKILMIFIEIIEILG